MSELIINDKGFSYLKDVTFGYVKVKEAVNKYKSSDKEWSIDVIVDKATFKAFKKAFAKNVMESPELENGEYLKRYKVDTVPFPAQDEQYVIKLKQSVKRASGDMIGKFDKDRPTIVMDINGKLTDITFTKLVGNGSTGDVAFTTWLNVDKGSRHVYLRTLRIEDLVHYEAADANAFGEVQQDEGQEEPEEEAFGESSSDAEEDEDF